MKNLTEIRSQVHYKFLKLRRMERIINSVEFEIAYNATAPNFKEKLDKIIDENSADELLKWVRHEIDANIGDYTIRQLRQIASQYCIPNYGSKNKIELLMAIAKVTNEKRTDIYNGTGNGTICSQAIFSEISESIIKK